MASDPQRSAVRWGVLGMSLGVIGSLLLAIDGPSMVLRIVAAVVGLGAALMVVVLLRQVRDSP